MVVAFGLCTCLCKFVGCFFGRCAEELGIVM